MVDRNGFHLFSMLRSLSFIIIIILKLLQLLPVDQILFEEETKEVTGTKGRGRAQGEVSHDEVSYV